MPGSRRVDEVVPVFVDTIPRQLEEGRLYIALRYRTVTHLCTCGCGGEINTPLHPTGWAITYDGVCVSLWPSVGNWSERCGSHYLIERNKVRWSRSWSRREILEGRAKRWQDIRTYHSERTRGETGPDLGSVTSERKTHHRCSALLAWLRRRMAALRRR